MRDPNYPDKLTELDDIDRLFARLDRAPAPDDLTARVLASTVARSNATRAVLAWPWMLALLAALALLTAAGYDLGVSLASNDGLVLVGAMFDDVGLLATAPGDVLAALNEVIPWSMLGLAALSAGILVLSAGNVVSRVPAPARRSRPTA